MADANSEDLDQIAFVLCSYIIHMWGVPKPAGYSVNNSSDHMTWFFKQKWLVKQYQSFNLSQNSVDLGFILEAKPLFKMVSIEDLAPSMWDCFGNFLIFFFMWYVLKNIIS